MVMVLPRKKSACARAPSGAAAPATAVTAMAIRANMFIVDDSHPADRCRVGMIVPDMHGSANGRGAAARTTGSHDNGRGFRSSQMCRWEPEDWQGRQDSNPRSRFWKP